MKQHCTVEVGSSTYRLLTDAAPERLEQLATLLNQRLAALDASTLRNANAAQKLLAVALGLAEELQTQQGLAAATEARLRRIIEQARAELEATLQRDAKRTLRQSMRSLRQALPAADRLSRAAAALQRLHTLQAWQNATQVAAFAAIDGELEVRLAWAQGGIRQQLLLPRVEVQQRQLTLHAHQPGAALTPGWAGIEEPAADAPQIDPSEVDLLLIPALAVDRRGYRVGYGGGYYDRLLPRCTRAVRCALIYDFQLVPEVPTTADDQAVHWVITDRQAIRTPLALPG